jgi:uncharacterized membrane protein
MLTFEQPFLLLLLIPIGLLVFLSWRRMSLPFPSPQRSLILTSRLLLFTLIVAALAGPALSLPISRQAVVFVADLSASTLRQRVYMEQWINQAIQHKRPDDQVGIVTVGRNALVEQAVTTNINFSQFETTPDGNYTDLAAGLRLAAAILPQDSQRRIVLLSDGRQNLEDALPEAQLLQQQGIRLDIVPLPSISGPEARVDDLTAPATLHTNEHFELHVQLYSSVAQRATLSLYLDQGLLLQRSLQLQVGEQAITFDVLAPPAGFHTYRVTLDAPLDTISQNNEASAFVDVLGPPQVLVIEGRPGAGQNIVNALQATKINVSVETPTAMPDTLQGLVNYDAIVLADVPALALGTTRMVVLQSFVRDLGHGLVVSGGVNSYGAGGYASTPLEATLPVMQPPQRKQTPSIAVVLIVESLESNSSVNISLEAAKGVINLLTPNDYVAVSEAGGSLAIPMQHVTDKAALDQAVNAMYPNDPQSYLPDLIAAEKALLQTDAPIKHVILVGDGDAEDNYGPQVQKMASEHISVSVIGTNIGSDHDLKMMQQIAAWGKSRFYQANDPNSIPQILLDETQQVQQQATINEIFTPAIVEPHPILAGLGPLPRLTGYDLTAPKPAAQQVLISNHNDPILAVWQYGPGRVVAWTGDALGLWTANWLRWDAAARWWANLVTWVLPAPDNQLLVNGQITAGSGHIIVDLPSGTSSSPARPGQQQVQVKIIAPDLSLQTLTLQPTAPGRWEGNFPATQVGAYVLRVTWQARSSNKAGPGSQLTTTAGLVVPYSSEYRSSGTDLRFLGLLARAGGGALLGPKDFALAFSQNLPPANSTVPITFWLLALAALLLPVDIALRRLASLEFLISGYRWLAAHLRLPSHLALPRTAQVRAGASNALLSTMRIQRETRSRHVSSLKPKVAPARTPNLRSPTVQPQPDKEEKEITVIKKPPEVEMAEKLLEAKRKRTGKQRPPV